MPFEGQILKEDHGDGRFIICVDRKLITECGAQRMQELLDSHIAGDCQELDDSTVLSALRAVRG
jgi:hypothetical protein